MMKDFTIIITTFNRKQDLYFTLSYFSNTYSEIPIILCDDASTDGTVEMVKNDFPKIDVIENKENMGLIHNRNTLLEKVKTPYVISIDDDAHFLTANNLEIIQQHFIDHPKCAVASFRIFWGIDLPESIGTRQRSQKVSEYAGGAHAMRMEAWKEIPPYPAWYRFYGEEQFASLQFFKKGWEIYYLPAVLVHHRVALNLRKRGADYVTRTRRALHASWSNYIIFYPWSTLPRKFSYSLYRQMRLKVLKRDLKAGMGILGAIGKLFRHIPEQIKNSNRLSQKEYQKYIDLPSLDLYWTPQKEH